MNKQTNGTSGLHRFERNNYFYGKLLTVRDMATEQAYHSDVQRTLSRHVTGAGGICKMEVTTDVKTDDDGDETLVVSVSEGLALDRCGRLIVVADDVTKELPLPVFAEEDGTEVETDTVSVYVEYDECHTEPVPVAKTESACDDNCEDNRVIEDADITVEPGDPGDYAKSVADVEFPDPHELGETDDRFAERISVRGDLDFYSDAFDREETVNDREETVNDREETVTLDFVFTEGLPAETAEIDLHFELPEQKISGRLSLPTGQFLDEDGLRIPDGKFDVTGALSQTGDTDQRTTDLGGTLEIRETDGQVTIEGVLDLGPEADREIAFDQTIELSDGGFSIDQTGSHGEGGRGPRTSLTLDADIDSLDGDRLVTGKLEIGVSAGETATERVLFGLETTEWEREDGESFDGLFVDVPEREGADPTEAEIDHLLARMARSYYEDERRESCPEVTAGPILVGTVTRDGETWSNTTFERGPLVYTNDMLYDILARHVTDFENPHDVKLEVGSGAVGDGGSGGVRADASLGVSGPAGPEGTVGITSSDNSIDVTPNRGFQSIDFTADVGIDAAFKQYHVFEQSLQNTAESYTELVEDSSRVWAPQRATHLAFRIARTAMHAIEEGVHESPAEYIEYLTGPHRIYYPEEQIPMATSARIPRTRMPREEEQLSVVDLERQLVAVLDSDDESEQFVPVRNYRRAVETLVAHLDDNRSPTQKAVDVARAQHRVAAAAETLLDSHPAFVGSFGHMERAVGFGRTMGRPRIGRAVVPDLSGDYNLKDVVNPLLSVAGWTYLVNSQPVTAESELEDHVNQVVDQVPKPGENGHKAAGISLQVIDPPGPDRIDGIGDTFARRFARAGIDTLAELAVASPDVSRLVTGVPEDTAIEWDQKAAKYCDTYDLTHVQHIGLLQAEAFAEVDLNLREYSFETVADLGAENLDFQELLASLEETSDDDVSSKYQEAIRRLERNWDEIQQSVERYRDQ